MAKKFNREKFKAFIQRRKINALGLAVITAASAVITTLCALFSFPRTDILAIVTVLLILLCLIQLIKYRKGFRTMHTFKGSAKKRHKNNPA